MLLVGLTGGIGAGQVDRGRRCSPTRGAVVVDADSRGPGRRRARAAGVRAARRALRARRSSAPTAGSTARAGRGRLRHDESRKDLEAITHPAIDTEFLARIRRRPADAIVVCDVPLLVESETGPARGYEVVIVVEAPLELRLDRLEGRGVPRADAEARMAAQATDEERRALATYVVDNGGDRAHLEAQVDEIWADLERHPRRRTTAGSGNRRRKRVRTVSHPVGTLSTMPPFELVSEFAPAGDQPEAIAALAAGRRAGRARTRRCSASPARGSRSRSRA